MRLMEANRSRLIQRRRKNSRLKRKQGMNLRSSNRNFYLPRSIVISKESRRENCLMSSLSISYFNKRAGRTSWSIPFCLLTGLRTWTNTTLSTPKRKLRAMLEWKTILLSSLKGTEGLQICLKPYQTSDARSLSLTLNTTWIPEWRVTSSRTNSRSWRT